MPGALAAGVDLGFVGGRSDGEAPIEVLGDPELLAEAIHNLIDNAIKYRGDGRRVTVTVDAHADGAARVRVDDEGPGIPVADRGRVLERFHRGPRPPGSAADTSVGTGLGLAIVAEIVRGHGGAVRIEDGPGGRGTAVTLVLPRAGGEAGVRRTAGRGGVRAVEGVG
ncbi:MAG: sensor histidine kinase [Burkholderiales bacterium]